MFCNGHLRKQTDTHEDIAHVCLQLAERGLLVRVCPRAFYTVSCYPESEEVLFCICLDRILFVLLLLVERVAVSALEEVEVSILPVRIAHYSLQSSEEQCTTHHVKVGREGIHNVYKCFWSHTLQVVIVSRLCQ